MPRPDWKNAPLEIRPHYRNGIWQSDGPRFAEYSRMSLDELLVLAKNISDEWPAGVVSLKNSDKEHSARFISTRKRDCLSDSVKIFTAMAVEGFLNLYGVLRLGQVAFDKYFERMGPLEKLKALLDKCDSIVLDDDSPIAANVANVAKIAKRRNALVHANTEEIFRGDQESPNRWTAMPGSALEAVEDMGSFFRLFIEVVPEAKFYIPDSEHAKLFPGDAQSISGDADRNL